MFREIKNIFLFTLLISSVGYAVDLSDEQNAPQVLATPAPADANSDQQNVFNKQWFQKVDIAGTLAFAYAKTGASGARPYGSWNNKEGIFWITAEVWENVEAVVEWFPFTFHSQNTGESYINFKNIIRADGENRLSVKVGRFDLPYGEEYLQQDMIDNPLISRSAAFPWAWDGGIMLYGTYKDYGWVATMTDGKFVTGADGDNDNTKEQGFNLKLYKQWNDWFYTSASYVKGGEHNLSAFWIGNNWFIRPGGTAGAGAPNSGSTATAMFTGSEFDVKLHFANFDVLMNVGSIILDDMSDHKYDRRLNYWMVEPVYMLNDKWYVAGRQSFMGANSDGYKMANSTTEGTYVNWNPSTASNQAGKVQNYYLSSLGFGYKPNYNTRIVVEYTSPKISLNDTLSTVDPLNNERNQWGLKFATKF